MTSEEDSEATRQQHQHKHNRNNNNNNNLRSHLGSRRLLLQVP